MAVFSCLSYPGSKRKVVDLIMDVLPEGIEDWREPFFGGGSVSIAFLQSDKSKDCKKFIVGDLYPEIWAFWVGIQKDPQKVIEYCYEFFNKWCPTHDLAVHELGGGKGNTPEEQELYTKAIAEGLDLWNWAQQDEVISNMNLYQRAARFFLINQTSFSSMSDSGTMSKDGFMGFSLNLRCPKIIDTSRVIQPLEIVNDTFQVTMSSLKENSFVFLDPPYIAQEKSGLYGKKGSTHHGFPHQELADLCKSLDSKWLMTIDDSIVARKLYRGMEIEPFHITYTLAGKTAEDALAGEEIFISNYKVYEEENFDNIQDLI